MFDPRAFAQTRQGGGGPIRLVRRLVVLAFAVIQLVLVGRILLDIGVVPADWGTTVPITAWSDALAAPVERIGDGLFGGGLMGGSIPGVGGGMPGLGAVAGGGFNPVMVAALAGWTVVEGLLLRVVGKFAAV